MTDSMKRDEFFETKSHPSSNGILDSTFFNEVFQKNDKKRKSNIKFYQATCGDVTRESLNGRITAQSSPYVTYEEYNALNREQSTNKNTNVIRSSSTIFYDLDEIGKRHSFTCISELGSLNAEHLKIVYTPKRRPVFRGHSDIIVQECATQICPKLVPRDSMEINAKKIKANFPNNIRLSSEILLKDEYYFDYYDKSRHYENVVDKKQKFWSYAKYKTEYVTPVLEEKKSKKKKDCIKRTDNPCPCQLFSYACPCTSQKSLTELAKNCKSVTIASNQIPIDKTVTDSKKGNKKHIISKEDKPTSTINCIDKYEIVISRNEIDLKKTVDKNTSQMKTDDDFQNIKSKTKSKKNLKRIKCPNCNEKLELGITEDEISLQGKDSSSCHLKQTTMESNYRQKTIKSIDDSCDHEPRCELIPVCQITSKNYNSVYLNHKSIKKPTLTKTNPRIIRITKACRHHPPCTSVPSCQKANVLNKKCDIIPPCLHQPRCVNMPLCVPLCKNHYYDTVNDEEKTIETEQDQCCHLPRCKYIPECQVEAVSAIDTQFNLVHFQNVCDYYKKYLINNNTESTTVPVSSCQAHAPNNFVCNKSTKSCQYICSDNRLNSIAKDCSEAVIYIRDVGCQFRNKSYLSKDSAVRSKVSSMSFQNLDDKMDGLYTNVHTLRYEDKWTNPDLEVDLSTWTTTSSNNERNSQDWPGLGSQSSRGPSSGFEPQATIYPYAYTLTTLKSNHSKAFGYPKEVRKNESREYPVYTIPVRSRKSLSKSKHKKILFGKRKQNPQLNSSCQMFRYYRQKIANNGYDYE